MFEFLEGMNQLDELEVPSPDGEVRRTGGTS